MSLAIRSAQAAGAGGISRRQNVQGGGILSSIGGALKTVARTAVSVLAPAPIARVANVALSTSAAPSARLVAQTPQLPGAPMGAPRTGVRAAIARALPGGDTGLGGGCSSGFHPNKTAYFLRDGTFVDVGTRCVKNRRRNPLNPRALDRSLGRIASTGNALKRLGFKPPNPKKIATSGKKPSRRRKS